jgi:hypothetical protein
VCKMGCAYYSLGMVFRDEGGLKRVWRLRRSLHTARW